MKYKVYDTIIDSEIKLLNIPEYYGSENFSAQIKYSNLPSAHIPPGEFGTYYTKDIMAMSTDYGTLEVSNGLEIKVYLIEGCSDQDIAPFIIGWGFAFLFSQRGCSILHCSALNINGHGVIISGVSGAGKSSTALNLINNGAQYLVDDLAVIDISKSNNIIPAYPVQKVCRDITSQLSETKLVHINEGRDKFAYFNPADYSDKPVKISHFIMLKLHDGDEVIVSEKTGFEKWLAILSCLYLNELYVSFGTPNIDKYNCLKMAEISSVLEISRPRGKNTINIVTQDILDFVNR